MARPKTKNKAVCQNKNCSYYLKEKSKDITKQGKNYAKHQRFLCKHCGVVFVETKGTPLYQKKLSERKIKEICKELVEKKGIRAVERTLHIHRDTIGNLLNGLAEHALAMSNHLVHDLGLKAYEVDELWTFVKTGRRTTHETWVACSLRLPPSIFEHAQKYTTPDILLWTLSTSHLDWWYISDILKKTRKI